MLLRIQPEEPKGNNSLLWNETSGNGYATSTAVDFGIGVVSGDGNIMEPNTAIGNANGIVLFGVATNNQVRQNVAVGNPPDAAREQTRIVLLLSPT